MHRVLLVLVFVIGLLLAGCNVDQKIMVANSDPDDLFAKFQIILKDKVNASLDVETNTRVIKAYTISSSTYPSYIELGFSKANNGTEISVRVAEEDKQKLANLYSVLKQELEQKPKYTSETIQLKLNTDMPVKAKTERTGHKSVTAKDRRIDRNRDGWVTAHEWELYLQSRRK